MYNIISQNGNISRGIYHLMVDIEQDIQTIPTNNLSMGSTVYVIASDKKYTLNSNKEWIVQKNTEAYDGVSLLLTDSLVGTQYSLKVVDGKVRLEEVTE